MIYLVRIDPDWAMSISESLLGQLVYIINQIEKYPERNPDQIILNELKGFYERILKGEPIKHSFSDVLINSVKKDVIRYILRANKEYLKNVSQSVMDKLNEFFIDYFTYNYYKYKDTIEVGDEEYVRRSWGEKLLSEVNQLRSSPDLMIKLENRLKKRLHNDWNLIESTWNDFKVEKISNVTLLKLSYEILDEELFNNIIFQFIRQKQEQNITTNYIKDE